MNLKSTTTQAMTFAVSVVLGCGAAIAIASAAAVSQVAPTLRVGVPAAEVVRLDPVVVTISKDAFDAASNEQRKATEVARANPAKKVARG